MGMDRNTVIGFVLIGALLIAMFVMNSKSRLAYEGEQKRIADSVAKIIKSKIDTNLVKQDISKVDSMKIASQAGGFQVENLQEKLTVLENDVIKVTFTNKGAQPKAVELKKYKKYDGAPVILNQSDFNKISYRINTNENRSTDISNIVFKTSAIVKNADKSAQR